MKILIDLLLIGLGIIVGGVVVIFMMRSAIDKILAGFLGW
jgi:hypothetical protein